MAEVSPSILAADFAALGEQVRQAELGGARMLHVDVMDGHFVPNISIGIPVVESLARSTDLILDCHLMVARPEDFIQAFIDAGAKMVTVHQETCPHLWRAIERIRSGGAAAGVALNPATPLGALDEVLADVDLALIMSVDPGFGGQSFLPGSVDKIRRLDAIRRAAGHKFRIQVDGGVNLDNAGRLAAAGCDILVAGSSVFRAYDIAGAVRALARRAGTAAPASG
ncbi:MAG: ribulose-phosphate 3-epimerase [Bryobacterales bacterium]|nr:ribulose-phosphate 3-epimerase [Bryobacterales bacterium]